jgi:hypothetical protein
MFLSCYQLPSQKGVTSDALGKAKGFLKIMKEPATLKFMLFMTDVVSLLSKLSLMLQDTSASVADIKQKLDATISILRKYKFKYA